MTLTKAELLRLVPPEATDALRLTVSCDVGFSARVPDHRPCGACTSCQLRYQSLTAAGLGNLIPWGLPSRREQEREFNFNAMLWQVIRLRACLDNPKPWQCMQSEFPELTHVTDLTKEEVVRLYRAYVDEWGSYERAAQMANLARREGRTVAL